MVCFIIYLCRQPHDLHNLGVLRNLFPRHGAHVPVLWGGVVGGDSSVFILCENLAGTSVFPKRNYWFYWVNSTNSIKFPAGSWNNTVEVRGGGNVFSPQADNGEADFHGSLLAGNRTPTIWWEQII